MEIVCNHESKVRIFGMCPKCYKKWRYHNDPEYRKKALERTKQYMKIYWKKNKKLNREKQKIYREKHPDKFNYIMCKYYFKKLSEDLRKRLLSEVYGQERSTNQA